MRLMSLFPWLCVCACLGGLAWMYTANQKKDQELAALREDSQQLQQLRAEVEEAKTNQVQSASEEVVRLRKDHEELLRLRNEVRQLRGDKQQLNTQLQAVQTQVEGAKRRCRPCARARHSPAHPASLAPEGVPAWHRPRPSRPIPWLARAIFAPFKPPSSSGPRNTSDPAALL